MNDRALKGGVDRIVDRVRHQDGAGGDEAATQGLRQNYHVGFGAEIVGREKWSGTIHTSLDFVKHEQRAVSVAERLRFPEVVFSRDHDAGLRLNRLDDVCGKSPGRQLFSKGLELAEWNGLCVRQQWSEPGRPEW